MTNGNDKKKKKEERKAGEEHVAKLATSARFCFFKPVKSINQTVKMLKIFTPTLQPSSPTLRFICAEGRVADESR